MRTNFEQAYLCGDKQPLLHTNGLLTDIALKPTRVGVRADDIGAQRLEEACIPRDGGF
jgi:hypothetical protein